MNFSAKEDDNRDELHKFLDAWSLKKDGVSFKASFTARGQSTEALVTIDALGNIQSPGVDRPFKVTGETYRFDPEERFLEITPSNRGASVTFIRRISD